MHPIRLAVLSLSLAATVAGCDRLPGLGSDLERTTMVAAPITEVDPRPALDQVTGVTLVPRLGGAVLRVTALPDGPGYYDAELVEVPSEAGELRFVAVAWAPPEATPTRSGGIEPIRLGLFLSDQHLAGISRITVEGTRAARSIAR